MPAYRLGHKIGIIAALRLLYHSNKPDGLACRHSASANGFAVCTAQLCHVCQLAWHILFYSGKNESDLINEGAGRTPCSFVYNLYSQSPSAVQAGLLLQSCAEKLYQWVNAHVQAENFLAAPCTFPIGTASKSKPAAPIDGAARRYEALIPHAASGIRRRYAFEYTAGSQAPFPIFCAV